MNPRTVYAYLVALRMALFAFSGIFFAPMAVGIFAIASHVDGKHPGLDKLFEVGWQAGVRFSGGMLVVLTPTIFVADFLGFRRDRLNWPQFAVNARELRPRDLLHPGTMWKLMERSRNKSIQQS